MEWKRRDFIRAVGAAAAGGALPGAGARALAARLGQPGSEPTPLPPEIYWENVISWQNAVAWGEVPFWRNTPNLFMFARHDLRNLFNPATGTETWCANVGPDNHPLKPVHLATSLYNLHRFIYDNWAAQWAFAGKAFRLCPCWVGAESLACNDQPFKLRLFGHPDDGPHYNGGHRYFGKHGRAEVRPYLMEVFELYKDLLLADGVMGGAAALNHVPATFDNIGLEAAFDFANPQNWADSLNDPRAGDATEPINAAGHTLLQWAAAHNTLQDGVTPVPPPVPSNCHWTTHHPCQWDIVRQADEADHCFQATSIFKAVSEPFQLAFDRAVPHGSWQSFTSGRAHPVFMRPSQYRYLMDNDFALGMSVPTCYGNNGPFLHYADEPTGAEDWRYEAPLNIIRHISTPGSGFYWPYGDPSVYEPGGSKHHLRGVVASVVNCMNSYRDLYLTNPSKPYTLSIAPYLLEPYDMGTPEFTSCVEAIADLVEYLWANAGLRRIWFHSAGYHDSAVVRAKSKYQVQRINARFGI